MGGGAWRHSSGLAWEFNRWCRPECGLGRVEPRPDRRGDCQSSWRSKLQAVATADPSNFVNKEEEKGTAQYFCGQRGLIGALLPVCGDGRAGESRFQAEFVGDAGGPRFGAVRPAAPLCH